MERDTSTALLDGPDDAEEDAFLDAAGFAGAEDRDREPAATEESDEDDESEDSEDPDGDEDADEEPAEDDEEAEPDAEDEDEPSPSEVAELRRQLQALQERDQQREAAATRAVEELHAERQRVATAGLLIEMRARMTDAEWDAFTGQLAGGYKDAQLQTLQAQVQQYQQAEQDAAYQTAETEAFTAIMGHVESELGRLSPIERRLLEASEDADHFKTNLKSITEHRRGQTEPARTALREKRRANGADRPGVRSAGGARPAAKSYDNYDPERFDAYLDDVGAAR